jgi:hypothetical protein
MRKTIQLTGISIFIIIIVIIIFPIGGAFLTHLGASPKPIPPLRIHHSDPLQVLRLHGAARFYREVVLVEREEVLHGGIGTLGQYDHR